MISIALLMVYVLLIFLSGRSLRRILGKLGEYCVYGIGFVLLIWLLLEFYIEPGTSWNIRKQYAFGAVLTVLITLLFVLFCVMIEKIFIGIGRALHRQKTPTPYQKSRRNFVRTLSWAMAVLPFGGMIYAMVKGKYNFRVFKHTLYFQNLPEAFDGYRITQISDIHSGSFDNREKIEYAVNLINEQQSDVILFTGDMVNNRASEMIPWKSVFAQLSAKDGCFSVLGNHDYGDYVSWETPDKKVENLELLKDTHKQVGFDLLLNDHRFLTRSGQNIALVGVENWGAGRFSKHGDLDKALQGVPDDSFTILMSHDPTHWQYKVLSHPRRIDLTLSGHTHGMQFGIEISDWNIKWSPIQWIYKYWAGVYREKDCYLNVNRGFGYLAFPGRLGVWPEITVIELKRQKNS